MFFCPFVSAICFLDINFNYSFLTGVLNYEMTQNDTPLVIRMIGSTSTPQTAEACTGSRIEDKGQMSRQKKMR